jgi:hypothetical protein
MSNVKALKLVSGEELVVEITDENESSLTFKNPVAVVLQRRQDGPALGFVPWMQAGDGPFTIELNKIITQCEVANEVKNGYNEIFGAGIVVPPKQLIT